MPIDATELRRVMGYFATGVTVVTSMIDDRVCGMTANSFASVSLDPPLVLFCAETDSETRRGIQGSKFFGVNILDANSERVSRMFATRGPKDFQGVGHHTEATGAPILDEALAWVDCSLHDELEAGDHVIEIGLIERADARAEGHPLLFFRGGYHTLS